MDDAKQWLQEKGVALLMDQGIKALIDAKPSDPALFLSRYYLDIHEKSKTTGAVITEIGHPTLCAVLKGDRQGVVVVDMRDETNSQHVAGAVRWGWSRINSDKEAFLSEVVKPTTKTVILTGNNEEHGREIGNMLQAHSAGLTIYTLSAITPWVEANKADPELVAGQAPRNFAHRRGSNAGLRIDVPEAPETMSPAALSLLIRGNNTVSVVDVRDTTEGGTVKGALHIPCSDFVAGMGTAAERFKDVTIVVLASHVSPDLDMTAATPLLQTLHEAGSQVTVFILSGGIKGWLALYGDDPMLVEGSGNLGPPLRERKRRSTGMTMKVEVPESPPQITPAELSALLLNGDGGEGRPWAVVDVSADGGHLKGKGKIAGSTQLSSEEILANMEGFCNMNKDKELIVVVSMMAHDLDEAVAVPMQQGFQDAGSNASVVTLIGGLKKWITDYHRNPSLVEELDPSAWGIEPQQPQSHRRNSTIRRNRPGNISVPEAPQKVPPLEVQLLVKSQSQSAVIVDVRPTPTGGTIKGAVKIPIEDVLGKTEEIAKQWAGKTVIVFVSMLSPDLDLVAATAVMQVLRAEKCGAQVSYLMGGLASWMTQYGLDSELTEGYEPAYWVERRHSHERC